MLHADIPDHDHDPHHTFDAQTTRDNHGPDARVHLGLGSADVLETESLDSLLDGPNANDFAHWLSRRNRAAYLVPAESIGYQYRDEYDDEAFPEDGVVIISLPLGQTPGGEYLS